MSVSMSTSAAPTPQLEDQLYDEISLPSCAPSDEWGKECKSDSQEGQAEDVERFCEQSEPNDKKPTNETSWFSKHDHKSSYLSNSSFTEYLSNIIPSRFSQGCSTVTGTQRDAKADVFTRLDSKTTERSSHSRCYIENTESIRDRRDDRREERDANGDNARDDSGNNDAVYSVEEYTQISEITMDIPTVVAESKFIACSGLPTIEEAKRFDPAIAACTAEFSRKKMKARCGATGENLKGGSKDVIDFVFELVEDTFCVPLNRSKEERKKAFMEAYHEESIKFARTNSLVDPWQTSSKHSRSNRTPRRSGKSPFSAPGTKYDKPTSDFIQSTPKKGKEDAGFMIVDKSPPPRPQIFPKMDEEQTLDWSKIMSFAEKQLEADGKSVISKATEFSSVRTSMSDRRSFFTTIDRSFTATQISDSAAVSPINEHQEKSTASSTSSSSSTHATAAESANIVNEPVQDLPNLSLMDSSSFEEPRRLLLTSLLLRSFLQLFAKTKNTQQSVSQLQNKDASTVAITSCAESVFRKMVRFTSFFICFALWPAGIPRRKIEYTPILKKSPKPSLLKLVFEADEQQS
ncbi:hypothetical protein IV203_020862 [Nitzschia inconspicua]|uniref:Uncharacterized protein n=1 Tax=Nitzschia inconspicua TaxID=303405 RepID=A0A9K3KFT4_9STRA|nr:hypothetical protein IV203_020862 [Nitzschia inconspicua]